MAASLSPPKIVLVAVHLASTAKLDDLSHLAAQHGTILRKELLLRILLTYLPETLASVEYVSLLQQIDKGEYTEQENHEIDLAPVEALTEDDATRQVRKLRLEKLTWSTAPQDIIKDTLTLFLYRRSYKVDEEAGLLTQIPALLLPFLDRSSTLRTWTISTVLPLLRRNYEYYPEAPVPHTLAEFEALDDRLAVDVLLDQTGPNSSDASHISRDLRGMLGPWIHDQKRWKDRRKHDNVGVLDETVSIEPSLYCPGWEQFLSWLVDQATQSWQVATIAVTSWDGPADVDLEHYGNVWLQEDQQRYLEQRYARTALAAAYSIPEATAEALEGVYDIVEKVSSHLDDPITTLQSAATLLAPVTDLESVNILSGQNIVYLRNDLLEQDNVLTKPSKPSTRLLAALALSAYLCTRAGLPCTIRRAGELVLLRDEREQRAEALKLIHAVSENGPKSDDKFWTRIRNEILWLRDWGDEETTGGQIDRQRFGLFCQVERQLLEVAILKTLLTSTRYDLARTLYETSVDAPLPLEVVQDTVYAAAMTAYDQASNPNRSRGGLRKCDDILQAFPQSLSPTSPLAQRAEALLKATHALSDYRLVLKQGEPFAPIILRVHQDPVSIMSKVLEQNATSYTKLQELVNIGLAMVKAGLTTEDKTLIERRVTAMCVEAALNEHDFETAYSYVVNYIATISQPPKATDNHTTQASPIVTQTTKPVTDNYSWKAALSAGKYRRTTRTLKPTHLGTASGNPEIRHLTQRIECLATALRIAPASTLQETLNTYRRCEEELDAAVLAEAEQESAWDEAADQHMPGGFGSGAGGPGIQHVKTASIGLAAANTGLKPSSGSMRQRADEAPMSLFDLSRATMQSAQKNLTALSNLQGMSVQQQHQHQHQHQHQSEGAYDGGGGGGGVGSEEGENRTRKRDQLRDAAMGTLTSGVGWLIGAPVQAAERE